MSILQQLNQVKDTVPHYWPIGSFIHHNPLKGFEGEHFKTGLTKAQSIFGGKVYMDSAYFMDLYQQGKINLSIFESNLRDLLKEKGLEKHFELARTFLMDISPQWESLRRELIHHEECQDTALLNALKAASAFKDQEVWFQQLVRHMTLYEINDALFGTSDKEDVEKDVIEYIARFLDEEQTTLSMPNRERGMFEAFKLYEGLESVEDAETFVETSFKTLKVTDHEAYFLTHILKLHGWAGFIKYRSEDPDYFSQQQHPSSLMDYIAIRLHYELAYVTSQPIHDFEALYDHFHQHPSQVILKLLKYKNTLPGSFLDALEATDGFDDILNAYIMDELRLDALQIQHSNALLGEQHLPLTTLSDIITILRQEEGYIWLKSLEDTYIHTYVDQFTEIHEPEEASPTASATFCLDVRSEVIRRSIENSGPYKTYGAGGFLGIPIAFVEFDKAHEQFLCPAVLKPGNVVFEVPKESYEQYSSKKGMNKTTKKVLNDLKNNPYTPYIMVEAIGWIFGINLFGKTFLPKKTNQFLSKFKPQKPKTTYTLDKLSEEEIEFYVTKLHTKIIQSVLADNSDKEYSDTEIQALRNHLIFNEAFPLEISDDILEKLKTVHQITPEDYEFQKNKLSMVGFTLEEKVKYLYNYLTMIGQVDTFPAFVIIVGHGSVSDNNPFESALDCGACGGNSSLPNTRALCMIANTPEVREAMKAKGIHIPEATKFMPAIHNTTTDQIKYYDSDILTPEEAPKFFQVMKDFNDASSASRSERSRMLPYTHSQEDIIKKSMDWSEPRPEWGLAGNMGVFAGPRSSIKHVAFNNRLFMHSYDWKVDNDNADILTRIFNGPLVVGEWINLEHYFSTVDNHIYGAGSKVYHNIVSKVGVYYGNYSDLKIGLPTQSVLLEGKAYHEPIRLLTFMEAPLDKVGKAVENSVAKEFILNEWIRPVIIDKEAKKVYSYESGDFKVIKELV